jgi:hypothetical protein
MSAWPVHLTGHAVSEAMSEVVAAVAFDGYDEMLPDSSRLLYVSKRRNNGGGVSLGGGVTTGWSVYVV